MWSKNHKDELQTWLCLHEYSHFAVIFAYMNVVSSSISKEKKFTVYT